MKILTKILYTIAIIAIFSCKSTAVVSSWIAPNQEINLSKLKKVIVVVRFKSETSNRKAEDKMVQFIGKAGIASYNYLQSGFENKSLEVIKNKIKKDGFDGAISMRLLDVEQEKVAQQQGNRYYNGYRDFDNYFYQNQISYFNTDYYVTTKKYIIETNVFSIKKNKIIWTGVTETIDPNGVEQMIEDVANAVYKKMKIDGLFKK
ncbi:MAG: hypothetical protein RLZZ312_1050 [Bacteroidota bacterium]|jgi:hypothetical protein